MKVAMDLATITGQREDDLLTLPNRDPEVYSDEGLVFRPAKSKRRHPRHGKIVETSKIVIVEWSAELREVIERAHELGPDIRPTLVCNLQGDPQRPEDDADGLREEASACASGQKSNRVSG
jgi:hypothetical protein